ncbi:DNA-binding protein [Georgfuchsia toluolica]|uniref:DNA-binding protein n=1 Tax=Georgfuchsia toluolica TaxID=424218 RepID=A0A916J7W2_9PROT|nr:OB-fold domain-containing protein [Georgfuchsia toluolica]CAG4884805.1 DNA-binding protein [Georgfuchsia toluolica]
MDNFAQLAPIAEGLFTWPSDDPHLIGSKCLNCGAVKFPRQGSCSKCCSQNVEEIELEKRGTLWTWTIQAFPPKSPPYRGMDQQEQFVPFGVGYIELPGQVCVESPLTINDPALLYIGMPMELVVLPLNKNAQGIKVMSFAFRPATDLTSDRKDSK